MSQREARLRELGYELSPAPKPAAKYRPIVIDGFTAYLSGALPFDDHGHLIHAGRVPDQVSLSAATAAAAMCAVNLLRVLKAELGSLERVERVLRLSGYVHSAAGFTEQHVVLNGASELVVTVFQDAGLHSRSAVGVAQLPLGASVEVDMIARVAG